MGARGDVEAGREPGEEAASLDVEEIWRGLQDRVFRVARGALTVVMPVWTVLLAVTWGRRADAGAPLLPLGHFAVLVVATAVVWWPRLAFQTRLAAGAAAVMATAIAALLQFGATLGTGLLFTGAALTAGLVHRRAGAVATYLGLLGAYAGAAVCWELGVLHPESPVSSGGAVRIGLSLAVTLGVLTYAFVGIRESFVRALGAQIAARQAERLAQEQRERVLRRAATSQRLESLGRLAGGVAHDFNNALAVIQTDLTLLRDDASAQDAEVIDEALLGVARAAATARQLLAFAREDLDQQGSCRPAQVVPAFVTAVRRMFPENIRLNVDVDVDDGPAVSMPDGVLEQSLLHLLLNARDAMPGGGELLVRVRSIDDAARCRIEVIDHGAGIADDVRDHLFDPFFTTKGEHAVGLGLSLVWAAVTRRGGQVEVSSTIGKGTTIALVLPRAVEEQRAGAATTAAGDGDKRGSVLVLEDEPTVRMALVRVLQRAGHRVRSTESVREATAALDEESFDLLLTDGLVGDGSVASVIRAFRAKHGAAAPVILCSAYFEDDLVKDGVARGECVFIAKPFDPRVLVSRVSEGLRGEGRGA